MRRSGFLVLALLALAGQCMGWGAMISDGPATLAHAAALPPLPAGWPGTVELGLSDAPGGAAGLAATAPFRFRYQYLAGGVNTGGGWATWNANGDFATYYIQDSVAAGITPVFTYYMLLQSTPGGGAENQAILSNLNNSATMASYYTDFVLLLQKAAAFSSTRVVVHVEPDLWGYVQQSGGDNAAAVPVKVAASGAADLAGLPNTAAGFAQALVRLRDHYAPNVVLGYHVSVWGTGTDIVLADPSNTAVDALSARAAAFYRSLGASFDLVFAEFADRDAGFYQLVYGDGGQHWFNAGDFGRHARFLAGFVDGAQKRAVLWQIPLGNTRMRAQNNTWGHYQDNRVEWLLDDPGRTHLETYRAAGVVAFLFGGGASGTTCACDGQGDGVTNPSPINGNTQTSLSADDDGGFFRQKARDYYTTGAMPLGGGTAGPTPTPTPPTAGFTTTATAPATVAAGQAVTITASITSATAATALVDVEVYGPGGTQAHQTVLDNQSFGPGQRNDYPISWTVPSNASVGVYTVKMGVFSPGWGSLYTWNDAAAQFSIGSPPTDTTPPTITAVQASPVSGNGATITWATNEASDSQVEYGLTTGYGSNTSTNTTLVTSHSTALSQLIGSTTYHYRVKSKDAAGNLATSTDFTFATADTTPPTISAVQASALTSSSATIAWTTGEAADSQVEYGPTIAFGASTTLNPALVTSHSTALSGLIGSTTYHYRVKSKDAAGNLATSSRFTFATAAPPPPASFTSSATVTPTSLKRGKSVTITAKAKATAAASALVDIEVFGPGGVRVYQKTYDNQSFSAGQQRTYVFTWQVPTNAAPGTYVVKVGVFKAGWGTLYTWNDAAAQFTVS